MITAEYKRDAINSVLMNMDYQEKSFGKTLRSSFDNLDDKDAKKFYTRKSLWRYYNYKP